MPLAPDVTLNEPAGTADAPKPAETTTLVWQIHRLRDEPERLPGVLLAYLAVIVLGGWLFAHPLPVALLVVALTGAIAEYLFPVTYRLTDRGAHSGCGLSQLFIAWDDVKRATHGKDGIHLSPFAKETPLNAFRGVRLRYGFQDAETVLATVRRLRKGDA